MSNAVKKFAVASIVAAGLVVVSTPPARAQGVGGAPMGSDERQTGIGVGVKGGFLFSNLTAEGDEDVFEQRMGHQVGVFFGGNRGGRVGVMAEVNYGKKTAGDPENDDNHYDINFVSVPVVVRVNGGSRSLNGIHAYGIVGPQLDWLISQKIFAGGDEFDVSDDTEGFEVSLVAGAGIEITRFIVEARYIHGLKALAKDFDFADAQDLKSRAFAILFGIRFN
jgi:hypothetical protein